MTHYMDEPLAEKVEVPTQILYPLRAVLRTAAASIVGAAVGAVALYFGVQISDEANAALVELVAGILTVTATAGVTWIMTRPTIADLLRRTPLAPTPPTPTD